MTVFRKEATSPPVAGPRSPSASHASHSRRVSPRVRLRRGADATCGDRRPAAHLKLAMMNAPHGRVLVWIFGYRSFVMATSTSTKSCARSPFPVRSSNEEVDDRMRGELNSKNMRGPGGNPLSPLEPTAARAHLCWGLVVGRQASCWQNRCTTSNILGNGPATRRLRFRKRVKLRIRAQRRPLQRLFFSVVQLAIGRNPMKCRKGVGKSRDSCDIA